MTTKQELVQVFNDAGPMDMIYHASQYSLAWLVENIFRDPKTDRPLRILPFQMVILDTLWHKKFPLMIMTRGGSKSFLLALYACLRALLIPGSKIVIAAAGYRQAKLVFKYIEELYNASPIFQEAVGGKERPKYASDAARLQVGSSVITALPTGNGDRIRGFRATTLLIDETASISEDIFDVVLVPFTSVHANPVEKAAIAAFTKRLKKLGATPDVLELINKSQDFGNQIVLSGTGAYKQNHFYKRYAIYKMFIDSKGDSVQLKKALEAKALQTTGKISNIDADEIDNIKRIWNQYAIIQLPYTAIPEGFMDIDSINSAKASYPTSRFTMEFLAGFPDDSDGFIKRSWIDRATPMKPEEPVQVELYGDPRATYVLGLDPARHNDNCAAVVLKLTPRGKELVYCDAWDRTKFEISAQKIREICWRFNIQYIAMDHGGGGESIREWLCKKQDTVKPEDLIWVIPDQIEKYADKTDIAAPGRKILEMVNFRPTWISDAAHGVEAAIEQRNILFPSQAFEQEIYNQYLRHFQGEEMSEAIKLQLQADVWGIDEWEAKQYKVDPKLGIMNNINECINETCAIMRYVTPGGTESFELPKMSDQIEGLDMRRRDRWSALMLANYAARVHSGHGHKVSSAIPGGSGGTIRKSAQTVRRQGSAIWYNPNH
jgi:hypothetical protein